ncbi:MAG: HAMP domain-containing protein [Micromonosporaceae bacterium]|nr:HAMP domain-containing protein [Micromonosporaceae bacterium]
MTGRPPAAESGPPRPRGLFKSRLRDARIRSKLGLILIIPLIAVVALAAVRLVDSGQRALAADLTQSLARVSAEASGVSQQLHLERMRAAQLLADPAGDAGAFNAQAVDTDAAVAAYTSVRDELGELPDLVQERLDRVDDQLATLDATRQEMVGSSVVTISGSVLRYGVILSDIIAYQESVAQVAGNPTLAESVRAVAALSKAKNQMAEAQAVAYVALVDDIPGDQQLTPFLASQTGQQEALLAFTLAADATQLAAVNTIITGGSVVIAERVADQVMRSAGDQSEVSAAQASQALGAVVGLTRVAEQRLHDGQLALADQIRDDVFQQVLFESVAVLLALVVAIAVAVLLARMLARSLGRLRENALAVADRELPATVARLSDPRTLGENTPAQLAAQVREPIELRSRDEIGQVAQAFNVVHRAAVRVAAEQAALRTSVSAMFLNLARRSQSLVDRMISQLDEIERHEEDPKRLSRMFALDHLATRMRRNDENLLVLAGADSSPPRTEDAPVVDALRAAQSEVEHYDRIEFGTVDADVSVVANAVNDVVRLVAELFDNATRFSPPESAVVCEARRLGDQMIIQIEDRGVGMSQDQVGRLNAWLATPPAVEVTTFRKMGLAVVARLASRQQIRVELRCDPSYGTIAYVALPRAILILPRSRMRSLEVPAPRAPLPVEQVPAAPPPPVPSRHLGQLPQRPAAVTHHAAGRRTAPPVNQAGTATGNGQVSYGDVHRIDLPVAGRPLYELTAHHTPPPAAPPPPASAVAARNPEATIELPIFKEMEAVWFRSHGSLDLGRQVNAPSAGHYPAGPPPVRATTAAPPAGPPPASPPPREPAGTGQPPAAYDADPNESWRTAADTGWHAAAAAAAPQPAGSTQSGLPKRVPQAQLVPGSVETPTPGASQRRSPEEVRGLLSAYHRGVQRGRESGAR